MDTLLYYVIGWILALASVTPTILGGGAMALVTKFIKGDCGELLGAIFFTTGIVINLTYYHDYMDWVTKTLQTM